ncbi:MAG: universal stress protein [Blastocatellia bacterium]|nr:universal stress protein [Blastocatellia bacterium]
MTPRTILLATDLSCRCDRALDRATMLAAEWKARLVVLHALQRPVQETGQTGMPSWRRPVSARDLARQQVIRDMRDAQGIDLDVLVEEGDPATQILEVVERLGCDLIVTGVARDETLGRILLGTTVEALTRKASVPVLVVRSRPRSTYRSVVVATDFSEGSRTALEAALALLPATQLSIFHAFGIPYESMIENRQAVREAAAREAMAESKAFLAATPALAESKRHIDIFCEYGDASDLLQDLVQTHGIDLVALGTKGRSGAVHMLLGSVAHKLLSMLPVDALVVRRRRS